MKALVLMVKQAMCLHWFDPPTTSQYEYSAGPFVCTEQRLFVATNETRVCIRCGLSDTRRISTECIGWQ